MIRYVELTPSDNAIREGCIVEVEVPTVSVTRKLMVKNNAHVRIYYDAPSEVLQGGNVKKRRFLFVPTGVERIEAQTARYMDSVFLYGDTVAFHIYEL